MMTKVACVCDFTKEELKLLRKAGYRIIGHRNEAGGARCPHAGNTCGTCPEHETGEDPGSITWYQAVQTKLIPFINN